MHLGQRLSPKHLGVCPELWERQDPVWSSKDPVWRNA